MTLSDAHRTKDVNDTLRILMTELGDRALSDFPFMQSDAAFAAALSTTWDELLHRRWIRATDSMIYVLTGEGWTAGLKLTGQLNEEFRERAFKLVGALKRKVAGRQDDAFVCIHDFDAEGFAGAFVFNIVESRVLEDIDPAKTYALRWSDGDAWNSDAPFFSIPRTLGQRRLPK